MYAQPKMILPLPSQKLLAKRELGKKSHQAVSSEHSLCKQLLRCKLQERCGIVLLFIWEEQLLQTVVEQGAPQFLWASIQLPKYSHASEGIAAAGAKVKTQTSVYAVVPVFVQERLLKHLQPQARCKARASEHNSSQRWRCSPQVCAWEVGGF